MDERLIDILLTSIPRLLIPCIKVTIPLTIIVFVVSTILGFFIALVQVLDIKGLKQFARAYIWIFRGTPLIVQLFIIFYGMPSLGLMIPAFPSAVIAFSLNYAAYSSETIRSAILSVPIGQTEAGYMVGMSYTQIMINVILPQAARVAFPTLFNSLIGLTKDTSLASSVTVIEMFKTSQQIAGRYFEPFALYCEAAVFYLIISTVLTFVQANIEKRLTWKANVKTIKEN